MITVERRLGKVTRNGRRRSFSLTGVVDVCGDEAVLTASEMEDVSSSVADPMLVWSTVVSRERGRLPWRKVFRRRVELDEVEVAEVASFEYGDVALAAAVEEVDGLDIVRFRLNSFLTIC